MRDWVEFEHEITELVRAFGYDAVTTQPASDFGADVVAQNQNRRVVVQCKLYGRTRIGADTVMKLLGSKSYFDADEALCITTSSFTKQAYKVAESKGIKLIDRENLIRLCRERNITIPSLTVLAVGTITYRLRAPEVTLGRKLGSHIVLGSAYASGIHAIIRRNGLRLAIQDCGSTNGTRVNGDTITRETNLNYGDQLGVGGIDMTVAMLAPDGEIAV